MYYIYIVYFKNKKFLSFTYNLNLNVDYSNLLDYKKLNYVVMNLIYNKLS